MSVYNSNATLLHTFLSTTDHKLFWKRFTPAYMCPLVVKSLKTGFKILRKPCLEFYLKSSTGSHTENRHQCCTKTKKKTDEKKSHLGLPGDFVKVDTLKCIKHKNIYCYSVPVRQPPVSHILLDRN